MERMLDDRVRIWRDVGGRRRLGRDDRRPAASGRSAGVGGRWAVVLRGQPAAVAPLDGSVAAQRVMTTYEALLPVEAPEVRAGDLLTVLDSGRDELLVGLHGPVRFARLGLRWVGVPGPRRVLRRS
ncbi:DUF6093 family protein [Streptomyces sp. NPDC055059]